MTDCAELLACCGLSRRRSVSSFWSAADKPPRPDVVLRNGKIYTADTARSIRQAIAFTGNTIVAVGDDDDVGAT